MRQLVIFALLASSLLHAQGGIGGKGGIGGTGGIGGGNSGSLPAFVQACNAANSGVASQPCTPSANVTSGNYILCFSWWLDSGGQTFTNFSKTSGTSTVGSFTEPDTTLVTGNNHAIAGYAAVTGTGTATITVTLSGAATGTVYIACNEVSGLNGTVDKHTLQAQSAPGTGTNAITSGSVTTTVNGDYLWGWTTDTNANCSALNAGTSGSGYTLRTSTNTANRNTEDQVQASAGAIAATFTCTGGGGDTFETGILAMEP
jgi:hypothetical protein